MFSKIFAVFASKTLKNPPQEVKISDPLVFFLLFVHSYVKMYYEKSDKAWINREIHEIFSIGFLQWKIHRNWFPRMGVRILITLRLKYFFAFEDEAFGEKHGFFRIHLNKVKKYSAKQSATNLIFVVSSNLRYQLSRSENRLKKSILPAELQPLKRKGTVYDPPSREG